MGVFKGIFIKSSLSFLETWKMIVFTSIRRIINEKNMFCSTISAIFKHSFLNISNVSAVNVTTWSSN